MSCILFDKNTFVRVAGTLAGIGGIKKHPFNECVFFKYNNTTNKKYEAKDFAEEIMSLYEFNLKAYCLRYEEDISKLRDNSSYINNEDYYFYFNKAKRLYELASAGYEEKLEEIEKLFSFINYFFSSLLYQIDDDKLFEEVQKITTWYSDAMLSTLGILKYGESFPWGDFDFFEKDRDKAN